MLEQLLATPTKPPTVVLLIPFISTFIELKLVFRFLISKLLTLPATPPILVSAVFPPVVLLTVINELSVLDSTKIFSNPRTLISPPNAPTAPPTLRTY